MGYYAEPYIDSSLALPPGVEWEVGSLITERVSEALFHVVAFNWAAQIPRRIGSDASAQDLAADKSSMNKLSFAYKRVAADWAKLGERQAEEPPLGTEHKKLGAQFQLEYFIKERIDLVELRQRQDATIAEQYGYRKIANRTVAINERELVMLRAYL